MRTQNTGSTMPSLIPLPITNFGTRNGSALSVQRAPREMLELALDLAAHVPEFMREGASLDGAGHRPPQRWITAHAPLGQRPGE